jgi:hypothetical protein
MTPPVLDNEFQTATIDKLRSSVHDLRRMAEELLAAYAQASRSIRLLRFSYQTAPDQFRQAGARFRRWAERTPYPAIKADYILVAESWEELAAIAQGQRSALGESDKELSEVLAYIEEELLFLRRFGDSLDDYPIDLRSASDRENFLRKLQQYVKKYEEMRTELRAFHKKVHTRTIDLTGLQQAQTKTTQR